jgi:hypothetical protein
MIERDTPERGPQSNADPRRSVNWTEFAPKDLPADKASNIGNQKEVYRIVRELTGGRAGAVDLKGVDVVEWTDFFKELLGTSISVETEDVDRVQKREPSLEPQMQNRQDSVEFSLKCGDNGGITAKGMPCKNSANPATGRCHHHVQPESHLGELSRDQTEINHVKPEAVPATDLVPLGTINMFLATLTDFSLCESRWNVELTQVSPPKKRVHGVL